MGSYEASNYEQLVKALRGKFIAYDVTGNHNSAQLYKDAADAIDALRKRLVSALTALHLANEKMGYYGIQPYTEADGEDMISDWVKTLVHEELKQQLPKHGEWVEENRRPRSSQFVCSECHRTAYDPQPTRDKAWKKRCRYAYCPNCGAKMEVQDGRCT